MSLEHAILGFLAADDLSGYDLKTRCLSNGSDNFWTADQAQIYRTLDRLSESGLVRATRERQRGKPDRKVFRITDAGRAALIRWLSESHALPAVRDAFLLQVMFAAPLPDDILHDVLVARRESHQRRLEEVRSAMARVGRADTSKTRDFAMRRMALEGEAATHRASIDWLDDCIDALREGLPGSPALSADGQRQLFPVTQHREKGGTE